MKDRKVQNSRDDDIMRLTGDLGVEGMSIPFPTEMNLPYPWCSQPEICKDKGYCTKDPNCGE